MTSRAATNTCMGICVWMNVSLGCVPTSGTAECPCCVESFVYRQGSVSFLRHQPTGLFTPRLHPSMPSPGSRAQIQTPRRPTGQSTSPLDGSLSFLPPTSAHALSSAWNILPTPLPSFQLGSLTPERLAPQPPLREGALPMVSLYLSTSFCFPSRTLFFFMYL